MHRLQDIICWSMALVFGVEDLGEVQNSNGLVAV